MAGLRSMDGLERLARPIFVGATIVIVAVSALAPAESSAGDEVLVGNWQVDIDCGLFPFKYATATSFLLIEEDPDGGGLVSTIPSCGTLAVPGSIQEMVECVIDPDPTPVGLEGTGVTIPPGGFAVSVSSPETPFPFPLLGCVEVDVITTFLQYRGAATFDEDGTAVRIHGILENDHVQMQDSAGRTCFSLFTPYQCSFEMRRNDVSPGQDVTVEPRSGARITFAEVLTPGTAAVVPLTEVAGRLPPGFQVVGDTVQVVFDVTTTAQFAGPVDVCVSYLDRDDDGFVDGTDPPVPEERVRLLHEEGEAFVDRTTSRDATANEVCGRTAGLSQFALGGRERAPPPKFRRIAPWQSRSHGRLPTRRDIGVSRARPPAR